MIFYAAFYAEGVFLVGRLAFYTCKRVLIGEDACVEEILVMLLFSRQSIFEFLRLTHSFCTGITQINDWDVSPPGTHTG